VANGSGSVDHAVSCGHAALTAMGMLDQNLSSTAFAFSTDERLNQSLSVSGNAAGLWDASVACGRERLRAVLARAAGRGH
jgi:hypothetical protein